MFIYNICMKKTPTSVYATDIQGSQLNTILTDIYRKHIFQTKSRETPYGLKFWLKQSGREEKGDIASLLECLFHSFSLLPDFGGCPVEPLTFHGTHLFKPGNHQLFPTLSCIFLNSLGQELRRVSCGLHKCLLD